MAKTTYDEKSFQFAEHFLSDHPNHTPADKDDFARYIQQAAEDWLQDYERRQTTFIVGDRVSHNNIAWKRGRPDWAEGVEIFGEVVELIPNGVTGDVLVKLDGGPKLAFMSKHLKLVERVPSKV